MKTDGEEERRGSMRNNNREEGGGRGRKWRGVDGEGMGEETERAQAASEQA